MSDTAGRAGDDTPDDAAIIKYEYEYELREATRGVPMVLRMVASREDVTASDLAEMAVEAGTAETLCRALETEALEALASDLHGLLVELRAAGALDQVTFDAEVLQERFRVNAVGRSHLRRLADLADAHPVTVVMHLRATESDPVDAAFFAADTVRSALLGGIARTVGGRTQRAVVLDVTARPYDPGFG